MKLSKEEMNKIKKKLAEKDIHMVIDAQNQWANLKKRSNQYVANEKRIEIKEVDDKILNELSLNEVEILALLKQLKENTDDNTSIMDVDWKDVRNL